MQSVVEKSKECVVVVPTHKDSMTAEEQRSFLNTLSSLSKWNVCLVLPENVSADNYYNLKAKRGLDFSVVFVRSDWMGSLTNYNKMLLAPEFYKTFGNYRYLLVCHLDAWVFRDELQIWIDKGYDYVGAPWFVPRRESSRDWAPLEKLMLPQGGNGGFCLRKIDKMIELLSNRKRAINVALFLKGVFVLARNKRFDFLKIFVGACRGMLRDAEAYQKKHNVYEDAFISIFCSFLDRRLSVAPAKDAKYFCVETNAAELLMTKMKWRLPSAVHGYDKYFSSLQEFDSYRNNVPRNEYTKRLSDRNIAKANRGGLPKITVITATHNIIKSGRAEVFRQCVESVHAQTYPNIEHIIIDGASKDGTLNIVQEYVDKGWCICYSEKDDGPWDAMHRGHEKATGEFVNFLNSDDYFCRNDAVEIAAKALARRKGDWFFSEGWFIRKDGTRWTMPASLDGLFGCLGILHQSVYVRTEILRGMDAFRSQHISRENHLMILLVVNGFKHVYSKKKLVCYREGGFSSNEYVGEGFVSDFGNYFFESVGRFWGLTEQECRDMFGWRCFGKYGVEACWRLARKLRIRQLRFAFIRRLVVHAWRSKQLIYLAGEAMPLLRPLALRAKAFEAAPRNSVETMLSLAPNAFVPRAYVMLLGREPDIPGLEHYSGRLRRGCSRLQIIAELRMSKEGRRFNALLPGLDKDIRPYRLRRWPVIGLIIRLSGFRKNESANGGTDMTENDSRVADGNSLFSLKSKELIYSVFMIFLGREPEPAAIAHYTKVLKRKRTRTVVLDIALSDEAVAYRRRLRAERDALLRERDVLLAERDALRSLRNDLRNENYYLRGERAGLQAERGVAQSDVEAMRYDWKIIHNEKKNPSMEPDGHGVVQPGNPDGRTDAQKSSVK